MNKSDNLQIGTPTVFFKMDTETYRKQNNKLKIEIKMIVFRKRIEYPCNKNRGLL